MVYKKLLSLLLIPLLVSCTGTEPVPFKIGKDACDHCKMTLMSKNYGMEMITSKGKIFKFDDISCGVAYFNKNAKDGDRIFVSNHKDGSFVECSNAHYLKSEKNRTPMNSMIVAFHTLQAAEELKQIKGGEILKWDQVKGLY